MEHAATEVGVREFRGNLGDYLKRANSGERFIVMSRGKPLAEVRSLAVDRKIDCRPGALKGKIWYAPDFDEPDKNLIDIMNNGPIFP